MAAEALTLLSADKVKRYDYERRLDEMHTYDRMIEEKENQARQIDSLTQKIAALVRTMQASGIPPAAIDEALNEAE